MEAQHEKRVRLVFRMRSSISSENGGGEDGYGNVYGARENLTFRIRTTSLLVTSDSCYPGEERGTHVRILFLLAFNTHLLRATCERPASDTNLNVPIDGGYQ